MESCQKENCYKSQRSCRNLSGSLSPSPVRMQSGKSESLSKHQNFYQNLSNNESDNDSVLHTKKPSSLNASNSSTGNATTFGKSGVNANKSRYPLSEAKAILWFEVLFQNYVLAFEVPWISVNFPLTLFLLFQVHLSS